MGEQTRVATARAILQQDAATALVAAMDARRSLLCREDAVVAIALHVGTFAASQTDDHDGQQRILAEVMGYAQRVLEETRKVRA